MFQSSNVVAVVEVQGGALTLVFYFFGCDQDKDRVLDIWSVESNQTVTCGVCSCDQTGPCARLRSGRFCSYGFGLIHGNVPSNPDTQLKWLFICAREPPSVNEVLPRIHHADLRVTGHSAALDDSCRRPSIRRCLSRRDDHSRLRSIDPRGLSSFFKFCKTHSPPVTQLGQSQTHAHHSRLGGKSSRSTLDPGISRDMPNDRLSATARPNRIRWVGVEIPRKNFPSEPYPKLDNLQ